jgi:type II secretory pathway pseudopilin PulG
MRKKGYLLLEVLVCIALITFIGFLGTGLVGWYDRWLVRLEVERLYAAIVLVRHYALCTNEAQELHFDCQEGSYTSFFGRHHVVRGVLLGIIKGIKGPPSAPTTPLMSPITFADNRILCYQNGVIDAGTVYLVDKSKRHLYAVSCGVAQEPYVRCYYYNHKWILLS